MEENTDVKRKMMTPSVPANYVSILQLRERWIKEKDLKLKDQEEEEERRRNQHAEEQQTIQDDLKKPLEDLDEMRLNLSDQKHWGRNSIKEKSIDGGEARRAEEKEETAAIRSERGGDEGLPEKKRGRRKRYDSKKKKRTNQEVAVVDECGSIKPPEMHTPVKDQIRVYRKKENKSVEKAVKAIETQFKDLSIKRGQETKKLKAQTRHDLPVGRVRMLTETATMVWVKKGKNERAGDGNGSGVKPLNA